METKIKTGDRVKFRGKIVRVLKCGMRMPNPSFKLSHFGWVDGNSVNNIKLVESIPDITLKNGDEVIIHDIPDEEKDAYGVLWLDDMENMMRSGKIYPIDCIRYTDDYGWLGNIRGWVFHLYHIEPANNFDII